jgi:hypothetical protein
MRILQLVVGAESLALVVLFVSWLQRPDIAPSLGVSRTDTLMAHDAANAPSGGLVSAAASATEATSRERASTPAGAGSPTVVLQGRLLGAEPPPKDDIVQLWCSRDDAYRSAVTRDGSYAIAGLRPGTWKVHCEVHGCVLQEFEHTLTDAPIQRLDFTLQPATVLPVFVVTPAGTRLQADLAKLGLWQSMHVIATESPLPGDLDITEHSSVFDLGLGRHRQPEINQRAEEKGGEGTLELDRPPPVFATLLLRHMVLARQRIEPGQVELRFVVDFADVQARMAKVRLRVLDSAGQPLAKARVEMSSAQGGGSQQVTGDDGIACLDKVLAGLSHFSIWAKDVEQFSDHVTVAPGASLDLGDVMLSKSRKVLGRIIAADGKGCGGHIQWTGIDQWRAPHPMQERRGSAADGDGNFELWGCGERRYVVRAGTQDGRVGYVFVDGRTATETRFEVPVRPATKVALDVGGDALATYVVAVRDPKGDLLEAVRIEPRWRQQSLHLPQGDYQLEIFNGAGRLLRKAPLVVGSQKQRVAVP